MQSNIILISSQAGNAADHSYVRSGDAKQIAERLQTFSAFKFNSASLHVSVVLGNEKKRKFFVYTEESFSPIGYKFRTCQVQQGQGQIRRWNWRQ
jgi:hypothetical protein